MMRVTAPLGNISIRIYRHGLMLISALVLCCLSILISPAAHARDEAIDTDGQAIQVTVNDTFINVHSGPGRRYSIFHVVERGEIIELLKSRTDWIKIKTYRDKTGWIHRSDLHQTLGPDNLPPVMDDPTQADYLEDRFEFGVAMGDFNGADSLTGTLGYRFTEHLSAELRLAQNTGSFSDSQIIALGLLHQPFPHWRISPFFGLGAGEITTRPSATLVETEDRKDTVMQASVGTYVYLTGRFFMRLEYTNHMVLTSRNTNEEVNEWKVGFNIFF